MKDLINEKTSWKEIFEANQKCIIELCKMLYAFEIMLLLLMLDQGCQNEATHMKGWASSS